MGLAASRSHGQFDNGGKGPWWFLFGESSTAATLAVGRRIKLYLVDWLAHATPKSSSLVGVVKSEARGLGGFDVVAHAGEGVAKEPP